MVACEDDAVRGQPVNGRGQARRHLRRLQPIEGGDQDPDRTSNPLRPRIAAVASSGGDHPGDTSPRAGRAMASMTLACGRRAEQPATLHGILRSGSRGTWRCARPCVERSANRLVVEDVVLDRPGPGELAVEVAACAICHSDIIYAEGGWGGSVPAVYGHEAAANGRRSSVTGVSGFEAGDHVVVTLIRSCGSCPACAQGTPVTCETRFPLDRTKPAASARWAAAGPGLAHRGLRRTCRGRVLTGRARSEEPAARFRLAPRMRGHHRLRRRDEHGRDAPWRVGGRDRGRWRRLEHDTGRGDRRSADRRRARRRRREARGGPALRRHPRVAGRRGGGGRRGAAPVRGSGRRLRVRRRRRPTRLRASRRAWRRAPAPWCWSAFPPSGVTVEIDPGNIASDNQRILGSKMGGARIREDIPEAHRAVRERASSSSTS